MFAVIMRTEVDSERLSEADMFLNDQVVPAVAALPGLVRATWVRALDGHWGTSFLLFEDEDSARAAAAAAEAASPPPGAPVSYGAFEIAQVIAQA